MKIKDISLTNFSNYDSVNVSFDENITYLIGKNGSGKSTIGITAMWFMFQGIAEKASNGNNPLIGERFRFIGNNAATAKGVMTLIDEKNGGAEIIVNRKLTKSGSELSFVAPEGTELNQQWLTDLFNIFLIAPKKFAELSSKNQALALGIDTSVYDKAIAELKQEHLMINRDLTPYKSLISVEKVERVDVAALQNKKDVIKHVLNQKYLDNQAKNKGLKDAWEAAKRQIDSEVEAFNKVQTELSVKYNTCFDSHSILVNNGYTGEEVYKFLQSLKSEMQSQKSATELYAPEPTYITELPDDAEMKKIDDEILSASSTNEKAAAYENYILRLKEKEAKEKELADNKIKQTGKEAERLQYIKNFKFPFSNLSVDDEGGLLLNGKPIKDPYFSTGELLKVIPILISSRNPELKYVFLQDFNLLDDDKRAEVEKYLVEEHGFQLVVELVGKEKIVDKSCILLKDSVVVESYEDESAKVMI